MTRRLTWLIVGIGVSAVLPACGPGEQLALPAVFSDHAVLQRGREIPVWGTADPGRRVVVEFAGQTKGAIAGGDGRWMVRLDPVPAGGPHTLVAREGLKAVEREDILVGDVWVCSGQSNMAWPVSRAANAEQEVADANYPAIRLMTVPRKLADAPTDDVDANWSVCTPETARDFSAVAYFFGRHLHQTVNVPVGLINTSWGGTRAEPWTPRNALMFDPRFTELLTRYDARADAAADSIAKTMADYKAAMKTYEAEWAGFVGRVTDADLGVRKQWFLNEHDETGWSTMQLPAYWEKAGLENLDGVVWFRKAVDLPAEWAGKDLVLELGPIDDDDVTYFGGGVVGETGYDQDNHWQIPRTYRVPPRLVKAGRNVIAVRVLDGGGNGGIYGEPGQMRLYPAGGGEQAIALAGEWKYRVSLGEGGGVIPQKPRPPGQTRHVGYMFNAMVAPLVPYAITGAIWYQGESNAGDPVEYRTLFPAMIRGWRREWGQGDFPFLFVQLANFLAPAAKPAEGGWAWVREAQAEALELPNTAMAVAIDIGEAKDIHPRNKQEVGRRLALGALKLVHGRRELVHSGPIYASHKIEGGQVRVTFRHVGAGLVAKGGTLKHFAVAGEDRVFHHAEAKIDPAAKDTVIVSSADVAKPLAVRYAWANNPAGCNLYNEDGLPAAPFRTDDWPAPEQGR